MIIAGENLIDALKIIVVVAVFFVWVVRYENIKKEFEDYKLPKWFRDFVGILKISFSVRFSVLINFGSLGEISFGKN